jgi:flagellar basal-body rod modification protein FlgD
MAFDAAAINANAQTASSASSISSRLANSKATMADSTETFLALMTTQLKNQDPLAPMDSTQFTQQIVQMTGVEQQLLTNDLLAALVGMNDAGLSSSVGLIGKDVTTQTTAGLLNGGKASFDFKLPQAASTLKLEIVNASGVTVATIDPADLTGKGDHSVTWNGKNSTGGQQPDGGLYTLKITALDSAGDKIAATATSTTTGRVTAVSQENGVTVVTVNGRKIPVTDIITVAEAAAATNSNTQNSNTTTPQTPADAA